MAYNSKYTGAKVDTALDKASNLPNAVLGSEAADELFSVTAGTDSVSLKYYSTEISDGTGTLNVKSIPSATSSKAGVMSSADKGRLDALVAMNRAHSIYIDEDLLGRLSVNFNFEALVAVDPERLKANLIFTDPYSTSSTYIRVIQSMPTIINPNNPDIFTIPFDDTLRNRIVMFDIDVTKPAVPVVGLRSIPKGNSLCMRIPRTVDGWNPDYGKLYLQYFQKTFGVDFYQYLYAAKNGLPVSFAFMTQVTLDSFGMPAESQRDLKICKGGSVSYGDAIHVQTVIGTTPIAFPDRIFLFPEADPNIPYTIGGIMCSAPVNSNIKECTVEVSWS